jgi:hypothetical protein
LGAVLADGYIKDLRRMLCERPTQEERRAQTRNRVRRHRERRREMSEAEVAAERALKLRPKSDFAKLAKSRRRDPDRSAPSAPTASAFDPQKLGNAAAAVRFLAGRGEIPTAESIAKIMGMAPETAAAALETLQARGDYDRIVREASLGGRPNEPRAESPIG